MSAHLHGIWPNLVAPGTNVVVRFFTPGTDTEIHKSAAITDASGNFDVYDAPVGTYDVGIKSSASLSELAASLVFTEGGTTTYTFPGWRGPDIDMNDWVSAYESNRLSTFYDQHGACSGYAGNWLLPQCPSPPPPGGACYGYIIS